MILVKLKGGLGNQMFQYAFGRNLAFKNKTSLVLDISSYKRDKLRNYELGVFNISAHVIDKTDTKLLRGLDKYQKFLSKLGIGHKYIIQKNKYFDRRLLNLKDNICLDGYWQCEDYFKDIRKILLKEFTVQSKPNKKNRLLLEKIKNSNSVAVHVRRTDYISNPKVNKRHGVCSPHYYSNAANRIRNRVKNLLFFIFSDDIEWCKKNLRIDKHIVFVDINNSQKGYEDLRLMKNCQHFIIANSSFSWWGAWLATNKNKIVYVPSYWFKRESEGDIIPKSWIRIER